MRVFHGYDDLTPDARGATVALGNFDGVHRGHQALLRHAAQAAPDAPLGVVTFEPHPRQFFRPNDPPFRLTTAAERARILARHGVARVYELTFDQTLARMTAEEFARDVLCDGLGLRHVVVGADFCFGRGRQGDAALLTQLGETLGFGVSIVSLVGGGAGEYSSTVIRDAIRAGRCVEAAEALGRWHTVSGKVIKGDQRGRTLGYPTANLAFDGQLIPRYGIYATEVTVHDGPFRGVHGGVASIGERPTFGINAPNFEVHLFDFAGDLYGCEISVGLVAYLRGEARFDSVDALITQMDADSARARACLAEAG